MSGCLLTSPALPSWWHGRSLSDLSPELRDTLTHDLLRRASDHCPPTERQCLLDQVVLLNRPIAESVAGRYRRRGVDLDDLIQVAYVGLIKAAQGYRPDVGSTFLSYAVPTITGEVKRYFRDHSWAVRPPRRLQELHAEAEAARRDLHHETGRTPTRAEVAKRVGVDGPEWAEVELTEGCFTAVSLDSPVRRHSSAVLADLIVDEVDRFSHVDAWETLRPALRSLPDRDQRILALRFVDGWTQERIGREIGVSQMQVSRLLTRILQDLRAFIDREESQ
ncbi:RNA polymerase sigma factor FliA [Austwickia sp. TVS 96-490-7B]|uniref:sigma-70 family RNA polymerase sigma factor n=1 Tax=Austwickia sp. TVS 96-490-7B TaxID=2830843 RepID=UPI001DEF019F|nr:sigma-70 family RNA polymerase sigma factor [Austwickia sp. TVS 96-490-7B]MBW3084892.1 RNA polymerase sigma factor FliA [Austwickia sp. TVS 96-490-7B]